MSGVQGRLWRDRMLTAGLAVAAVVCVVVGAGTGVRLFVLMAVGLVAGAVMVFRRTVPGQRYAHWVAWAGSSVMSVLLIWVRPSSGWLLLPWAVVAATAAAALCVAWRQNRVR
ncbi:hypothetical protein [Streptomyces violascens]|uniref:hypothetical protein n=1 Tax=Streptomyces violascens TaxID=67381 RepID=UPI0016783D52|nr:hypothetical protein [Streptomyces violascens]GGU38700.1 hypothetical protein GCM10010289_69450 [Streptomyces violascens]